MIRVTTFLALFIVGILTTIAQETFSITANFHGLESNNGKIYVALYNTKDSFLKKPFKGDIVEIKDLKATAVFKDLPVGEYAVSAFQDVNNNGKMDTKFFGIPKEPIGTSNDAKGFMGPPKFKKAKFTVDKDITIKIKIEDVF